MKPLRRLWEVVRRRSRRWIRTPPPPPPLLALTPSVPVAADASSCGCRRRRCCRCALRFPSRRASSRWRACVAFACGSAAETWAPTQPNHEGTAHRGKVEDPQHDVESPGRRGVRAEDERESTGGPASPSNHSARQTQSVLACEVLRGPRACEMHVGLACQQVLSIEAGRIQSIKSNAFCARANDSNHDSPKKDDSHRSIHSSHRAPSHRTRQAASGVCGCGCGCGAGLGRFERPPSIASIDQRPGVLCFFPTGRVA